MNVDEHKRVVVWMPNDLYAAIAAQADAAGWDVGFFIRQSCESSLIIPVSQTAARSGCAGRGEAAVSASPELGSSEVRS